MVTAHRNDASSVIFIRSFAVILFVASLGCSSPLFAERAKTPTLEEILQRLQANLNQYESRVPSLFCDEHVISHVVPGLRTEDTVTDSVFRLKHTLNPDHTTNLDESREIKTVNGKPATSQDMDGPTLLSGAFGGGLTVVSLDQRACMNYTLQRPNKNHSGDPYIVRFATVLTPQNSTECLLQENSKGRVFIDPASMQITHLELITPRHTIIPGNSDTSPTIGKRDLTVDYKPVLLGGESFWMPSTIAMSNTSGSGTFHSIVWSFRSTYHSCHKTEVTSRVLYGGKAITP